MLKFKIADFATSLEDEEFVYVDPRFVSAVHEKEFAHLVSPNEPYAVIHTNGGGKFVVWDRKRDVAGLIAAGKAAR